MNIRVDLDKPIQDGTEVVFRSPVDCSQVTGLIVYYKENENINSKEFAFADAHGNNVGDIDHLFAENVAVKVILDVTTNMAFVQNADTNAYLEGRFDEKAEIDDTVVAKNKTWSSDLIRTTIFDNCRVAHNSATEYTDQKVGEIIDDTQAVTDKAWSSKNTVDKLCPAFTESGATVVCEPVESYPLEVVSTINQKDDGSAWDSITLIHSGKNLFDFKQPVSEVVYMSAYGTSYRWGHSFVLPVGTYTLHAEAIGEKVSRHIVFCLNDLSGNYINNGSVQSGTGYYIQTLTLTQPTRVFVYNNSGSPYNDEASANEIFQTLNNVQIEAGSVATAYEEYKGYTELTVDFANLEADGDLLFGSYNWQTGVLDTVEHGLFQHNPETNTFTEIDNIKTYVPPIVRNIQALAGRNCLYSDCGDTSVSGGVDPNKYWAEKLAEQEAINAEQEAELAKFNKQYELIEEITIEEDTTVFLRNVDSEGNAYNFSAVRIYVETQPCTTATSSSQLVFSCGLLSHGNYIYHQVNNALNTTARATGFIARNDCGFVEYYAINSDKGTSAGEVKSKPHYGTALPWVNIERIQLACYPSAVYIPKGTTIKIYAIRG